MPPTDTSISEVKLITSDAWSICNFKHTGFLCFFTLFIAFGCGSQKPFVSKRLEAHSVSDRPPSDLYQTIILIGDAGEPKLEGPDPVLDMLTRHLQISNTVPTGSAQDSLVAPNQISQNSQSKPIVTFLGDNIYEYGLPEEGDDDRAEMEQKIIRQMEAVKQGGGKILFVPGNHDWNSSKKGGMEAVMREEQFIQDYLQNDKVFLPKGGCGGPAVLEISDDLVIIAIDSEWWLTKERRGEAPDNGCDTESDFDFLVRLEDQLEEYEDRNVVLVMHHPIFSNSNHGGHYSLGDNIFPLRLINEKLMIPLPIIGSIYPLLRKYGVSRQDIPHPRYQELKNSLLNLLEDHSNVIIASGHDHNLQLKMHQDNFYVVSGSGSKLNFVARGRKADFTHQSKGFAKVNYYSNGEVWLEFWAPSSGNPWGERTYSAKLYSHEEEKEEPPAPSSSINYEDSVKVMAAGPEYTASAFKKLWLGKHYRKEWATSVRLNYLDIEQENGGLVPLQKGGGKQTVSLRLQAEDEIQYTLRSVNKDPKGAVPEPLHGTFAESLVKDQISSAHPYGALVIPSLAKAADIYHTSPKLFYVPDDPTFGRFRNTFSGMMALLEIRPDEDLSQFERFGFSENVVSTNTLWQKLREDNDNEVDQQLFLRSRIFDMLIGDWDRHEDQWRWAEFEKPEKGSLYRPVPRDRDQVFTKFDGIIPWLASRKWSQRSLSHFDYDFQDIVGLNLSAEVLDRKLLNDLDWESWETEIKRVQTSLTDEVIEQSIKQLPDPVYSISGKEITDKLKSRREILIRAVHKYYLALAKHVDITGSEKHEYFLVDRKENGETDLTVFKTGKEGKIDKVIFERTFNPEETKEIRIFTLGGKDSVRVTGKVSKAIKLRVIGGNDENTITDVSEGGKVLIYDNILEENQIKSGKRTRVIASDQEYINNYEPDEYQYSFVAPRVSLELNPDDGLFLGGGVYWNNYGFRKKPYKSEHLLQGHLAIATGAFDVKYQATYYSMFGKNWDLSLDAHAYGPKYILNYFNQGNGTEQEINDIDYYRVRMKALQFEPSIEYRFSDVFKLGFGPTVRYYKASSRPDNITSSDGFDSPEDLGSAYFAGSKLFLDLTLVDLPAYPRRGLIWYNEWTYQNEVGGNDNFHKLKSDLSFYVTPNLSIPITLAMRFGVEANLGSYKFYQSSFLGGINNLRGHRRTRFAGKTAAYQNTEIRIGLSKVHSYFFTGYWGILGFIDHGRVWTDGEGVISDNWKQGYGPGLWFNFFKSYTLSMEYGISQEDKIFSINFGLQF